MGHSCSKYAGADLAAVEARGGNGGGGGNSGPLSSGTHSITSHKRRGGGGSTSDCLDPFMHDLMKRSLEYATTGTCANPSPPPTSPQVPAASSTSASHRNSSKSTSSSSDPDRTRSRHHRSKGPSSSSHRHHNTSSSAATSGTASPYGRPWMEQGQAHLLFKRNNASRAHAGSGGASSSLSLGASSSSSSMVPSSNTHDTTPPTTMVHYPTRLVVRRRTVRSSLEEGTSGTHIYAVRYPLDQPLKRELHAKATQEQCPRSALPFGTATATTAALASSTLAAASGPKTTNHRMVPPKHRLLLDSAAAAATAAAALSHPPPPTTSSSAAATQHPHQHHSSPALPSGSASAASASSGSSESSLQHVHVDQLFVRETLLEEPKYPVIEWVTVSSEHHVYVVDTGLSALDCDDLIEITEHACKGQYAAYTYAKQTLGCREFPALAVAARDVVHSVVHAIYTKFASDHAQRLLLDDREPHVVKYDVTKKERQKLDMHTDKSEWTFLIALSNGCGLDYDGGGTYFECLDSTVHVQRGQALVFPGRLRHCGQRITSGLRFLLVGFLVDKTASGKTVAGAVSGGIGGVLGGNSVDLDPTLLAQVANVP